MTRQFLTAEGYQLAIFPVDSLEEGGIDSNHNTHSQQDVLQTSLFTNEEVKTKPSLDPHISM